MEPKRELGGTQTELREPWRGIGRKGLQETWMAPKDPEGPPMDLEGP